MIADVINLWCGIFIKSALRVSPGPIFSSLYGKKCDAGFFINLAYEISGPGCSNFFVSKDYCTEVDYTNKNGKRLSCTVLHPKLEGGCLLYWAALRVISTVETFIFCLIQVRCLGVDLPSVNQMENALDAFVLVNARDSIYSIFLKSVGFPVTIVLSSYFSLMVLLCLYV